MADYFFDSSGLIKRHVKEPGTPWIKSLVNAKAGHALYIARITAVEVTPRSPAASTWETYPPRRLRQFSAISAAT